MNEVPGKDISAQSSIWAAHVSKEKLLASKVWRKNWGFMADEYNKLTADLKRPKAGEDPEEEDFATKEERFRAERAPQPSSESYFKYPVTTAGEIGYWSGKRKYVLEKYGPYCRAKGNVYKSLGIPEGSET